MLRLIVALWTDYRAAPSCCDPRPGRCTGSLVDVDLLFRVQAAAPAHGTSHPDLLRRVSGKLRARVHAVPVGLILLNLALFLVERQHGFLIGNIPLQDCFVKHRAAGLARDDGFALPSVRFQHQGERPPVAQLVLRRGFLLCATASTCDEYRTALHDSNVRLIH